MDLAEVKRWIRFIFHDPCLYNTDFKPERDHNFLKRREPRNAIAQVNSPFSQDFLWLLYCLKKQIFEQSNLVLLMRQKTYDKLSPSLRKMVESVTVAAERLDFPFEGCSNGLSRCPLIQIYFLQPDLFEHMYQTKHFGSGRTSKLTVSDSQLGHRLRVGALMRFRDATPAYVQDRLCLQGHASELEKEYLSFKALQE